MAVPGIVVALIVGGVVVRGVRTQEGASSSAPRKAEEQFKNIQMLKGIPADWVIPSMQFITASLGVECDFCHVQGAFDKDDKKPKQTARKMMEMMFAINVEIDRVESQTPQAGFAGGGNIPWFAAHAAGAGIRGIAHDAELGRQRYLFAPALDCLADEHFILVRP